MAHANRLAFAASQRVMDQFEESHDFFGGAIVALENLRWQVNGFKATYPAVTHAELVDRFAGGLGVPGGNAITLIERRSWEEQEQLLTQLRLISAIAQFESWCDAVAEEAGARRDRRGRVPHAKGMQFPTDIDASLAALAGPPLSIMSEVVAVCASHRHNCEPNLDLLMLCYRAFKEARNCLAHAGGLADKKAEDAWKAYFGCDTAWQAASVMSERPELAAIVQGQPVVLTRRGVVGLVGALQRIVATSDCRLAGGDAALNSIVRRWIEQGGPHVRTRNPNRALSRFRGALAARGLPALTSGADLLAEFRRRGVASL